MHRSHTVYFEDMGSEAPGCAYLESMRVVDHTTEVTLRYSTGAVMTVLVPVSPSHPAGERLGKDCVLAVHVRRSMTVSCVALLTAGREERRRPITLHQAMALAQDGVHTVFMTESNEPATEHADEPLERRMPTDQVLA